MAYGALQCLYGSSAKSVLAIMPDSGTNYLDTLYDDRWVDEKQIKLYGVEAMRQDLQASDFKRPRPGVDAEHLASMSY